MICLHFDKSISVLQPAYRLALQRSQGCKKTTTKNSSKIVSFLVLNMFASKFILGNIHQGMLGAMGVSRSLGTQCTAIAVVAFIFASFHINPSSWTPNNLDTIVFEGDSLYNSIVNDAYGGDTSIMLAHDDIPLVTRVFGNEYFSQVYCTLYGVANRNTDLDAHTVSVRNGLNNAFSMSNYVLATFGSSTVALIRWRNSYFLFDSQARNQVGEVDPNGSCVLLHFTSLDALCDHIFHMFEGQVFNFSPISFHYNDESSDNYGRARESLADHKYNSWDEAKSRGKKRKRKQGTDVSMPVETMRQECSLSSLDIVNENLQENVASFVEIECTPTGEDINRAMNEHSNFSDQIMPLHSAKYEEYIRRTPSFSCASCLRFLFKDQTCHLSENKMNDLTALLSIDVSSTLCRTCKVHLSGCRVPGICAKLNSLEVSIIPNELSVLNILEKKLLSKIQTFFTMIILPGGQYAEKGMVLNLPRNVSITVEQLQQLPDLNQMCAVRFENNEPVGQQSNYLVHPSKLISAFSWLKDHNRLYNNISLQSIINDINSCIAHENDDEACTETVNNLEHVTLTEVNSTSTVNVEDCLASTNTEDGVQSITIPRIQKEPVSIYDILDGEESAFPWLFPEGKFGFLYPRMHKLAPSMYFRARLYNTLGFWRKDMNYLLHAAVAYDTMLLKQEINIYMKMCKGTTSNQLQNVSVTAGDIRSSSDNPEIIQNSYMFMKNIRGTVAYFRNALYDLLAMFRTLGPPSLFVTLSADDLHWPELGMVLENLSYNESCKKGSFFSSMRSDPLLTAIHFERRLSALMKFILKSDLKPLGDIIDWFIRVEFQLRGSPHYHIFFWVDGLSSFSNETDRSNQEILQYINQTIKTTIPDPNEDEELYRLVSKLQIHSHTSYCMPSTRPPCRFGFPKRVCKETHLLSVVQALKNKGKFYETKRNNDSLFVNAYNPTILRHWRANMDIQVINNAEGAAYYVCHYLCKSEPDELKCALANLITNVFKQNPSMSVFQRLWNIGTCVLKHRRMSAQEAAFRLSSLKLIQNSRRVVYLNTRPIKKRYKMLKPVVELNSLPDESTDIFMYNIVDYYYARPQTMQYICLYEFASWFMKCSAPAQGLVTERMQERIYISKYDVWMMRRKRSAVVRYPTFSISCDDYYFSLLMLMLPHSKESELLEDMKLPKMHLWPSTLYLTLVCRHTAIL